MSAASPTPAAPASGAPHATVANALASEWLKLRSLRSTWVTLGVAVLLGVGLGVLIAHLVAGLYHQHRPAAVVNWDPTAISLSALGIVQLVMAVLGAMAVTGEYSSGMIRTSLTAIPCRGRLMAAKSATVTLTALVAGEVIAFAAFFLGQLAIGGSAPQASIGDAHVLRALFGAGLYLAVIALLACGIGFLVRSTAAAISVMVALLFVLPAILSALPLSWSEVIDEYWPTLAGAQVYGVIWRNPQHSLTAWAGFGDLCLFTAIVLVAAYWLLRVRNA